MPAEKKLQNEFAFFSFLSFFSLFSLCAPLIPFDPWASGCMGLVESLGHTQNPTTAAYGVEERVVVQLLREGEIFSAILFRTCAKESPLLQKIL